MVLLKSTPKLYGLFNAKPLCPLEREKKKIEIVVSNKSH